MLLISTKKILKLTIHLKGPMICFHDEAAIFMGMFGRYNSGGAAYDRGFINMLFNAPNFLNRDLKSAKTRVESASFNIVMLGHPETFGKAAREEMVNHADGLHQRILYNLPRPLFGAKLSEMLAIPDPPISIVSLIYAIDCIGKHNITFVIDEEATKLYDSYFQIYGKMIEKSHTVDSFFG